MASSVARSGVVCPWPALLAASVLFGRILSGPDEVDWGLGP